VSAIPARPPRTTRLARTLGLDGNPLRKAADRAMTWIRVGLLAAFLTGGPLDWLYLRGATGQRPCDRWPAWRAAWSRRVC
jgi:hypothetical protein